MAMPSWWQRAVLAIRDIIAAGGRVLRSSRGFWARFGFPDVGERQDAIRTAGRLERISNEIEAGTLTGQLAEALTDAGLPTTDISGGLTGSTDATIYGRVRFGDEQTGYQYRSFRTSLPWYSSLAQLEAAVANTIAGFGAIYGLEHGVAVPGSIVIY